MTVWPNRALENRTTHLMVRLAKARTRPSRSGCKRTPLRAGSLLPSSRANRHRHYGGTTSLGRQAARHAMPKPCYKKESTKSHPLVGKWVSGTESGSEIEYTITSRASGFRVRAVDRYDDEVADVFEIKWDGRVLSFGTLWNSTGRFLRCRLEAVTKN